MGILINSKARLGARVQVRQGVQVLHIPRGEEGKTGLVGDRVQLMTDAMLIRGAVIGEDSIVAARAMVNRPVPPGHIALGSPATTRPMRDDQFLPDDPHTEPPLIDEGE